MKGALHLINYLAIHHYTRENNDLYISEDEYYAVIDDIQQTQKYLSTAAGLLESYSSEGHEIGLIMDEWGTWYSNATPETGHYQQNTLRDALFTAASFHMFHEIGPRFFMANMAQTINVLQSLLLTKGPQMILTPTYHVYDMYQRHKGATRVTSDINYPEMRSENSQNLPSLSVSSSVNSEGRRLFITLLNLDLTQDMDVQVNIAGAHHVKLLEARRLTAANVQACNNVEEPNVVSPTPLALTQSMTWREMKVPAKSVNSFLFQLDKD